MTLITVIMVGIQVNAFDMIKTIAASINGINGPRISTCQEIDADFECCALTLGNKARIKS